MIPYDGNYYPWQLEVWEREKVERAKRGGQLEIADPNPSPAKLSNVLRFLAEARARPEIWERYVEVASTKGSYAEIEEGELYDLVHFTGAFRTWFRMRDNLQDDPAPYMAVPRVLCRLAFGTIREEDVEAIKAEIGPWGLEDDLSSTASDEKA